MRPLPVRDPGSLALLEDGSWSYPVWEEVKARETNLFDGAFAWASESFDLALGDRAVPVDGAYVSGGFFEVLGVPAFRGRMLTPADDSAAPPNGPVAVESRVHESRGLRVDARAHHRPRAVALLLLGRVQRIHDHDVPALLALDGDVITAAATSLQREWQSHHQGSDNGRQESGCHQTLLHNARGNANGSRCTTALCPPREGWQAARTVA
jgi:hypothetical protein